MNRSSHPMPSPTRSRCEGPPPGRSALVVGHPGHELRVFNFLERVRPTLFVLTDGSGSRGEGYNPTHDLCRMVIGAAVSLAGRLRDTPIGNYDFLLTGLPAESVPPGSIA